MVDALGSLDGFLVHEKDMIKEVSLSSPIMFHHFGRLPVPYGDEYREYIAHIRIKHRAAYYLSSDSRHFRTIKLGTGCYKSTTCISLFGRSQRL